MRPCVATLGRARESVSVAGARRIGSYRFAGSLHGTVLGSLKDALYNVGSADDSDDFAVACHRDSADGIVPETVADIEQTFVLLEVNRRLGHEVVYRPVLFIVESVEQSQDILFGKNSNQGLVVFHDRDARDIVVRHQLNGFEDRRVFSYADHLFCHRIFGIEHHRVLSRLSI